MKALLIKYFVFGIFLLLNIPGYSQESSVFNLLTEKYTQRPLTLHRGQIQFNSGYNLFILNQKYSSDGSLIDLRKDGTVAVRHQLPFELKFGVLEYLQVSAAINYGRMGIRNQNVYIVGTTSYLDRDELIQVKGLGDLFLGIDLRAPTGLPFLDVVLSAGYYMPVANHEPDKPEHAYFADTSGRVDMNYVYNTKFSSGVNSLSVGGSLKYKSPKLSVIGNYKFMTGLNDGKSIEWDAELSGGILEYSSREFNFSTGQRMEWHVEAAYQAIDWFTLMLSANGFMMSNAWSDITGKKIGIKDQSLLTGRFGYEIHVTPSLRLNQFLCYPFAGKNSMASFTFMTGLSINFISEAYHNAF